MIHQWVQITASPIGGVATSLTGDIAALLQAQVGLLDVTGWKCVGFSGELSCISTTAIAAGTRDQAFVTLFYGDRSVPTANRTPLNVFTGVANTPAWFATWPVTFVAAPISTIFNFPVVKRIFSRRKWSRLFRDQNDTMDLVFASGNAGVNYHVDGYIHLRWVLP